MTPAEFRDILDRLVGRLTIEARAGGFDSSTSFESRVRELVSKDPDAAEYTIDFDPHPQAFPDIAVGDFGIEVKYTAGDTWRSVANSVLERHRLDAVSEIYVVFGKMGGNPEVRWGAYEQAVMHVRTSHVPRFELDLDTERSLFEIMGITYGEFRVLSMHEKMEHIRGYARGRLKEGERLWWLEDAPGSIHSLPIEARLYTTLATEEKSKLRAEAALLSPRVVAPSTTRKKYDDAVLYILTYHGVLCHQARDLFTAGSVANPQNDDEGGRYIQRALELLERDMELAAQRLDDALFAEYWGEVVPVEDRLAEWLRRADALARDWVPSDVLFLEYQARRR
jgi:hypothetical protein